MALQIGMGMAAAAVVAKKFGPGIFDSAANWALDRVDDINSSQPLEEKTVSNIELWPVSLIDLH